MNDPFSRASPMTASTGSPAAPRGPVSPSGGDSAAPQSPTPGVSQGSQFEVPGYSSTDSLNMGNTVIQQFLSAAQSGKKEPYHADFAYPTLMVPDPDSITVEPSWQRATYQFFRDQVNRELKLKEIKKKEASAGAQDQGGKGAAERTQEKGAKGSKNQEGVGIQEQERGKGDEAAIFLSQLGLKTDNIMQAVVSNKVQTLEIKDQDIVKEATKTTRAAWSLPSTWTLGSQSVVDWKPVTTSIPPPINVDPFRKEMIAANVQELFTGIEKATLKIQAELPKDDSIQAPMADFAKAIKDAIRALKKVLTELQEVNATSAQKVSTARSADIKVQLALSKEDLQVTREEEQKRIEQRKMIEKMNAWAMWIGIGLTLLSIVTAGSATLVIAAVIVGVGMQVYSALDKEFGLTATVMTELNKGLEIIAKELYPNDEVKQKAAIEGMKIALVIVAIIIIVVLVAVGGGAAASNASSTVLQVFLKGAVEAGRQLGMQFLMIGLMASNIIPDLTVKILIEMKAISKDDEKAKMIVQIASMVFTMLILSAAMAEKNVKGFVSDTVKSLKSLKESLTNFRSTFNNFIESIKSAGARAIESMKKALSESVDRLLTSLKNLGKNLSEKGKELWDRASKAITEFKTYLREIGNDIRNVPENLTRLYKDVETSTKEFIKWVKESSSQEKWEWLVAKRKDFATFIDEADLRNKIQLLGLGIETANSISLAVLSFELAKLLEKEGDVKESIAIIKELIKLLEQMLGDIQENITSNNDFIASLIKARDSLTDSTSSISNRTIRSSA